MQRILVAVDGSDHSHKAADLASDLAAKYGAELVLLHVLSDRPLSDAERHLAEVEYMDDIMETVGGDRGEDARARAERLLRDYGGLTRRFRETLGRRLMNEAERRARAAGVASIRSMLEEGDPARTIVATAEQCQVDMIVMGSRGLGDARGLLMGSVSHKVAHLAACTCVAVK